MSYHTWHEYGYGICTDDIETTPERLLSLIHLAPEFEKDFLEWAHDNDLSPDNDDRPEGDELLSAFLEYEDGTGYTGLNVILQNVIYEAEDVALVAAEDFDCNRFLIFPPLYPWGSINMKSRTFTKIEMVDDLFRKYVNVLTDSPIDIEYREVENGG